MSDSISIRILEEDTNRRGDLFGRLMADLFVALGYEQPRLNIHKSGRELDLSADHRLEPRRAIGECKATAETIGGDELNKFVGALDVEHEDKRPLTGYFISLAGFKETAIEQEKQRRRTKIITLTGLQVVNELVRGRILIPKEKATELAGRCCADLPGLSLDPDVELLAHERGWIWAIYYTQGKARTHFALIHSDGTPLARALTDEVVASDRDCGGAIRKLVCLNPKPLPGSDTDPRVAQALAAYGQYLTNECGFIQLDGLPADSDVGSRRLRLENLFVPLHLDVTVRVGGEQRKMERQPVGAALSGHPRLALLAAPGGGKSTLVKRLAVAYADSARREQIDDNLPSRDWLPLFFRCRELRGLARGSFAELLEALSQREPVRQHAAVFRAYVDRALLAGRVLLLVDGLDEISDAGDRAAFVCTVRTALQAYPGIATIVTSREAGFRHVAAHLAPVCTHAVVSPFNHDDIRRLSVAWHREVVGDTEKVRADAEQLASTIVRNDRIKRLAVNPLLLTTLLLVRRWVGSLPTRRAVLYGKAVEVLLMTWNTEGHEPIPEEEALPQLCYVASAMMLSKVERISRRRLAVLLQEARNSLPTELGYVKGTLEEFIHRVEDRSSLLMMTGHDVEDGQLVEFFEFRHLTFQEFLTARAMVEGWHPGRREGDTLANVLDPHLEDEKWREVIPLAAVLGGKATEALIQRLTETVRARAEPDRDTKSKEPIQDEHAPFFALANCLADEAAARPETIRAAVRELVRQGARLHSAPFASMLFRGRYGAELREEAEKVFMSATKDIGNPGDALVLALSAEILETIETANCLNVIETFVGLLEGQERLARCKGALGLGFLCANWRKRWPSIEITDRRDVLHKAVLLIEPLVFESHLAEQTAGAYALAEVPATRGEPPREPDLLNRLVWLWRKNSNRIVQLLAARALTNQPIALSRQDWHCDSLSPKEIESLLDTSDKLDDLFEKPAAIVIAWYARALSDVKLTKRARASLDYLKQMHASDVPVFQTLNKILVQLGEEPERANNSTKGHR